MAKRQVSISSGRYQSFGLLFSLKKERVHFSQAGRDEVPEKADDSTPPIATPIATPFWFFFAP